KPKPNAATALELAKAERKIVFVANGRSIIGAVPKKNTALPESVTRLAKLRTLLLTRAQYLTKVLPDLGALTELEHLDFELVRKPDGVFDRIDFSRMTKLRELR